LKFTEVNYLMPWPGPQVMSVASTLLDPSTIDIQSSPEINYRKLKLTNYEYTYLNFNLSKKHEFHS